MTSQTTENQMQTQTRSFKKRFGAVAALTLLAALCVGGTLATPIARVDADNVISFGAVDIEAVQMEHGQNEEGEDVWVDVSDRTINARFGKVERRVQFTNTGDQPMFVRARFALQAVNTDEETGEEVSTDVPVEHLSYGLNLGEGVGKWTQVDPETPDEPIWYYYNDILAPGATTEPLVTSIELVNYNDLVLENDSFAFDVLGQGLQSEHQLDASGAQLQDATLAEGWPEPGDDGVNHEAAGNSADVTTDTTASDDGQEQ